MEEENERQFDEIEHFLMKPRGHFANLSSQVFQLCSSQDGGESNARGWSC
jgi:hypothetical protein